LTDPEPEPPPSNVRRNRLGEAFENAEVKPDRSDRWQLPPLSSFHRFPIVSAVGAAAIAVVVAGWAGWNCDLLLMDSRAWDGQIWRLPGSALPHIGFLHIAFNLYWLWVLGTPVESALGHRATAGILLLLAVGSAAAEYAISEPGVGLSGIVYGLFGLLVVLGRVDLRLRGVVDARTLQLFAGWFVVCWVMTEMGGWRIANIAHAAGAIIGFLLGFALIVHGRWRVAIASLLVGLTALALVGAVVRTPTSTELAYLGYQDLENDRDQRAADRFAQALEKEPGKAEWRLALGYARDRLGQNQDAIAEYRRALELRPNFPEARTCLGQALARSGYGRHLAGDWDAAAALYREALTFNETEPTTWYDLGLVLQEKGELESAREAFRKALQLDPSDPHYRAALMALSGAAK
jgi:membrane associated rhomboid family serine protease/Tfp pilus assembly protein PilF